MSKSKNIVIKGPSVKERKHFAPKTKAEKPKKGAGSYNRKETVEEDEQSCWDGYKKEGTKKKGGKTVNNCIKENNNISKFIDCILDKKYSDANKYLKDEVELKLAKRLEAELSTPLF
jgi:hypothetical protein